MLIKFNNKRFPVFLKEKRYLVRLEKVLPLKFWKSHEQFLKFLEELLFRATMNCLLFVNTFHTIYLSNNFQNIFEKKVSYQKNISDWLKTCTFLIIWHKTNLSTIKLAFYVTISPQIDWLPTCYTFRKTEIWKNNLILQLVISSAILYKRFKHESSLNITFFEYKSL